jgi:hypothetical protein
MSNRRQEHGQRGWEIRSVCIKSRVGQHRLAQAYLYILNCDVRPMVTDQLNREPAITVEKEANNESSNLRASINYSSGKGSNH